MASVQLHISLDNAYIPVLSIPVDDCNRFAAKPLRWLRYLAYTIYGRQGHISAIAGGPPVDYESAVAGGADYYFTSPEQPRLLDVKCIDYRTSDANTTESRRGFRENLQVRDGSCIVTNVPARGCEGAHLIPHSKGSEASSYISRLMAIRGDGQRDAPDIDDINDVRNGLLIWVALYKHLGWGEIAFLKTPNFAMNDDDVPPSPLPIPGPPSASPGRFILQHFVPLYEAIETHAPHNQDARLPADMNQFPPPTILDMFYGCTTVLRWKTIGAGKYIESLAGPQYYDKAGSGLLTRGEDDVIEAAGSPTLVEESPRSRRAKARASRHCDQSETGLRTIEEAMDFVSLLWMRSAPKRQEMPPSTEEEDLRRERPRPRELNPESALFSVLVYDVSANAVAVALGHEKISQGTRMPYLAKMFPSRRRMRIRRSPFALSHRRLIQHFAKTTDRRVQPQPQPRLGVSRRW
ncbi:hypothetical protein D9615_003273 [Tricholomella constricta]|uniref:HNH nuclease domain-containing protein n=1 Tax=Tricholomella constricta TaxID=117010 RepID=A0A8H5HII4_9AGAR|nr:hypothetical protein D9615_003273 [Tricholomella constricta]